MLGDFPSETRSPKKLPETATSASVDEAQNKVFQVLLDAVNRESSETVLAEFKALFFDCVSVTSDEATHALYRLAFLNRVEAFHQVLKRSCYILINNWAGRRDYASIRAAIALFENFQAQRSTTSLVRSRLQQWMEQFIASQDYEELQLFVSRYDEVGNLARSGDSEGEKPWSDRYASYLLFAQATDPNNSREHREAAQSMAKQLRDKFKFDLALYTARLQSSRGNPRELKNPTSLGDRVLNIVKTLVLQQGQTNYASLAKLFVEQTRSLTYSGFKKSLSKYLLFSVDRRDFTSTIERKFDRWLDGLYANRDEEALSDGLYLQTCHRAIEFFTTVNYREPSQMFVLLLSRGNPLTLVMLLLKIVLICPSTRSHLELCMARLIQYYDRVPEAECKWVVHFIDIFNVAFAIYTENVRYNLVKMQAQEAVGDRATLQALGDCLDGYRLFSQMQLERAQVPLEHLSNNPFEPPSDA